MTLINRKAVEGFFGEEPDTMGVGGGLPPRPRIIVPDFCKFHQHDFVTKQLDIGPVDDQLWQPLAITVTMLMFTLTLRSPRIQKLLASGRELQEILKSQGCMACNYEKAYIFVGKFLRSKGLKHAKQVAEGTVYDPEYTEWK